MERHGSDELVFDDIRHIFPEIIGSLESGIVVVGKNDCIDLINRSALSILDIDDDDAENFIDVDISEFSEHLKSVADKYKQLITNNKHKNFLEHLHIPPDKYVKVTVERKLNWTLFLLNDVTSANGLIHAATHDYLTQLYNRRYFEAQLEHSLNRSKDANINDVVAFIDLNGFKVINDLAGYMSGDQVLKKVADTILAYADHDDCAARIGGDEFAVLFKNKTIDDVKSILNSILKKVNEIEVVHAKRTMRIDFSCGLTEVSTEFLEDTDKVLATAILACGLSKGSSTKSISVLNGKDFVNRAVIRDSSVINLLTTAFEKDRLSLFGQKIHGGFDEGYVTLEVLLRLTDEHGDFIPPDLFIPIAERSNMMLDIDRWVVSRAFGLLKDGFNFLLIFRVVLCVTKKSAITF